MTLYVPDSASQVVHWDTPRFLNTGIGIALASNKQNAMEENAIAHRKFISKNSELKFLGEKFSFCRAKNTNIPAAPTIQWETLF
ncbi:MAG: hypothetical protein JW384_01764 [Nitrosomonadaceae bacterium]|nr:hypothetical protein [Nitrosomonadaceae bacterium]